MTSAAASGPAWPAPRHRRAVESALFVGWWLTMAVLPIGHVTGLRNALTIVVVLATLLWLGREGWRALPGRITIGLLLLWCAASIGWSMVPGISFARWRSDLLIPLLAYAAAFGYVRRTGSCAPIVGGLVCGMVCLALLSATVLVPTEAQRLLGAVVAFETFPTIAVPLPVWYPGVGDASMAASLAAAIVVCGPDLVPRARRVVWIAAWGAIAVTVALSGNRNAALAVPAIALAAWWVMRRRAVAGHIRARRPNRRTVLFASGCIVVAVGAIGAVLEMSARERLRGIGQAVPDGRSGLVAMTERDTRPMIWSYYLRLAADAPVIGVGFGRTVPGIHYSTQDDRALARTESNAYIHAHNLFLNWWLQTGAIGVALLIAAHVDVVARARRAARCLDGQRRSSVALVGLYALLALMLIRDTTDDFLVYGMATLYWTLMGCLVAMLAPPSTVGAITPRPVGINALRSP